MAILVLGGAGYIGSHTVYELIDAGRDVVVVDNLQTGFKAAVHPKAHFYQLDIRDRAALDVLFQTEKIEGVIHFAASSQVGESMSDPLKYYDNNLYGTMVLLQAMVDHGVDKIVFSSTAATYGEPELVPILETDKTVPTNCYGQTKLAMEQMMSWVSKAHGLRYVALRYFNACGAHPSGKIGEAHDPETHLIPIILQVPNGKREKVRFNEETKSAILVLAVPLQTICQKRKEIGMYASEKTRYKLAEAMKRLMESHSLEKITVSQIVELCDTTRPTFYRYFKDKYDLINWYFDKLAQKSFKQMGISLSLREALLKKFEFMTLEKKFFSVAFSCETQNNLIDYDYEMIYQFYCDFIQKSAPVEFTEDIEFLLRMYCRGSIFMTADWAKNGMTIAPEHMADLLIDALPPRLYELFKDL